MVASPGCGTSDALPGASGGDPRTARAFYSAGGGRCGKMLSGRSNAVFRARRRIEAGLSGGNGWPQAVRTAGSFLKAPEGRESSIGNRPISRKNTNSAL